MKGYNKLGYSTSAKIPYGHCKGKRIYALNSAETEYYISRTLNKRLHKQLMRHRSNLKSKEEAISLITAWREWRSYE